MWLFRVLIRIPLMAADALLGVKCLLGVNYFDVAFQGAAQNSMDAGWQQSLNLNSLSAFLGCF